MVTYATDTAAVVALGSDIVAMADGVGGAAAAVGATPSLDGPCGTAGALAAFAEAYGQTAERLRTDVVALGRLTQAVGAEYDAVEASAIRLYIGTDRQTGSDG
jgi:hypothetical protein